MPKVGMPTATAQFWAECRNAEHTVWHSAFRQPDVDLDSQWQWQICHRRVLDM